MRRFCTLVIVASFACTADTGGPPAEGSKAQARMEGKADGWDWCEVFDWYGDGECDDFCENPDPDCEDPVEPCDTDSDCPGGYCAHFASCLAIGCPPPPPSQCIYPDCNDGSVALCEIVPPECGVGQVLAVQGSCYTCADARTCDPAEPRPRTCGTLLGDLCGENEYCEYAGDSCGTADEGGTCVERPTVCTREFDPVCGCDGNTHSNACTANAAGVAVQHEGECEVICEPVTCALYCEHGFQTDERGCEVCECNPAPSCGTRGGTTCGEDEYCRYSPDANCGRTDVGGVCAPVGSGICPAVFDPVCGCDGRTYSNACQAAGAGVSVDYEGTCEPATCGGRTCDADEECQFCFGSPQCVPRGAMC